MSLTELDVRAVPFITSHTTFHASSTCLAVTRSRNTCFATWLASHVSHLITDASSQSIFFAILLASLNTCVSSLLNLDNISSSVVSLYSQESLIAFRASSVHAFTISIPSSAHHIVRRFLTGQARSITHHSTAQSVAA